MKMSRFFLLNCTQKKLFNSIKKLSIFFSVPIQLFLILNRVGYFHLIFNRQIGSYAITIICLLSSFCAIVWMH